MATRWIALAFLILQTSSHASAMCRLAKSGPTICFENRDGFTCAMKEPLSSTLNSSRYLRVNIVQIHLEPSGFFKIYGNLLVNNNDSCIIVTAPGSRCIILEKDSAGCQRTEKNESAAAFHFVSTAAGEKVELNISEQACEENSESNMTEAVTTVTHSTNAVERIFATSTTKLETSGSATPEPAKTSTQLQMNNMYRSTAWVSSTTLSGSATREPAKTSTQLEMNTMYRSTAWVSFTTLSAAPALKSTASSRLPTVTEMSAMRAKETSAAMQTTLVEQGAIASISSATIVLIIGVLSFILAMLAILGTAVRRKRSKRKASTVRPTSMSVVCPNESFHNVFEDDRVTSDYRRDSRLLLPDTRRYSNVPAIITPQQNLDNKGYAPVLPEDVNKPADSEYTLMAPGTPVTPRPQSFNNYVQMHPHCAVMSPACSKSLRQPAFENVRLKSTTSQSHDKKFALDQETTPKSAEPHLATTLGGTVKNRANKDTMYVDMAPIRTITDVTHHEPSSSQEPTYVNLRRH